jgi:hypothetical protein
VEAAMESNEQARLQALRSYRILDSDPEKAFDDLTILASHICETPVALISLIDSERQWFKSKVGVSVGETPREVSFCARAIQQSDLFICLMPARILDSVRTHLSYLIPRFASMPVLRLPVPTDIRWARCASWTSSRDNSLRVSKPRCSPWPGRFRRNWN